MEAVLFESFGPPSVLKLVTDHPRPERKAGEVLVRNIATSVNPIDYKTRKGDIPRFMVKLPKIVGGDVSGVVTESESVKFPVGSRVFSCTTGFQPWNKSGAYAEYVSIPEEHLAMLPDNLDFEDAAGVPLVSLTAWQALEASNLSPGQRLLVHAGAGGVGNMVIQLAKARGVHVTTTCSERNVDFCKELGADVAIDYNTQKFEDVCASDPFDCVIDLIGGDVELRSMKVLKSAGTFVSIMNSGWTKKAGPGMAMLYTAWYLLTNNTKSLLRLGPKYKMIIAKPNGAQLAKVGELLASGAVKPVVDRKLKLSEAAAAHEYMEQEHARGKVILLIQSPSNN